MQNLTLVAKIEIKEDMRNLLMWIEVRTLVGTLAIGAALWTDMLLSQHALEEFRLPNRDFLVERVQLSLSDLGYPPGEIDGRWGEKTRAAANSWLETQAGVKRIRNPDAEFVALLWEAVNEGKNYTEFSPGKDGRWPLADEHLTTFVQGLSLIEAGEGYFFDPTGTLPAKVDGRTVEGLRWSAEEAMLCAEGEQSFCWNFWIEAEGRLMGHRLADNQQQIAGEATARPMAELFYQGDHLHRFGILAHEQISDLFSQHSVWALSSQASRFHFLEGGRLRAELDDYSLSADGNWRIEEEQLCMEFPESPRLNLCGFLQYGGDDGYIVTGSSDPNDLLLVLNRSEVTTN